MSILLTGFEPFGNEDINPSALVVQQINVPGVEIMRRVLPTEFGKSGDELISSIDALKPKAVIMLGQAAGRTQITPERIAINIQDASIPDNCGKKPQDTPIEPGGPAAYFSSLPLREMVASMHGVGVPAAISNTAGTYVCNDLFYRVMHHIQTNKLPIRAGFVHIPLIPRQTLDKPRPSMDLEQCCRGLVAAIKSLELT